MAFFKALKEMEEVFISLLDRIKLELLTTLSQIVELTRVAQLAGIIKFHISKETNSTIITHLFMALMRHPTL